MEAGATGEDIQVLVIDERVPDKFNIYNDGDRLINTYYSNLPTQETKLSEKELSIIKKIKTAAGTRGGTTANNIFESADRLFLA